MTMNNITKDSFLQHYGVKGMKWGVRRYQNPDGSLTSAGKKRKALIRKTGNAMKTTKDANEIVDSLTPKERKFLGAPKYDKWIEPEHDADFSSNIAKRFVQYEMKDSMKTPVSFLEIWDDGGTVGQIAIATKSGEQYRGKGYASKSVKQGLDWYNKYGYKKLERLEWIAAKDNTASNNLAKKFGFKPAKWTDYDWAEQPKDNLYVYRKGQT
jgi:RimJ/RimL family protein N-acetyltransferase